MNSASPAPGLTLQRPAPRKRRLARLLLWPAATAGLLLLTFLGWRYAWPQTVEQYVVKHQTLENVVSGPATLDAINKASASSRVAGRLTQIFVDRNDMVAPGQIIATIEQEDLRNTVSASRSNLQAAQGSLLEANANLQSAQATLANARSAFERQAELRQSGWVSRAGFEQTQSTLRENEARVAGMRQAAERTRAQTEAAAAGMRVDEAQLALATVRAPFRGIVAVRNRNVGDVLSAGASILEIVDPSSIVITGRLDESLIGALQPGQSARIRLASDPGHTLAGSVLRLSREVDPETREFTIDITPVKLPGNWALGQRANIDIILSAKAAALVVPAPFVVWNDGKPSVWVGTDGRARRVDVVLAPVRGPMLEVRRGLVPGDIVLAPGGTYSFMVVARLDRPIP